MRFFQVTRYCLTLAILFRTAGPVCLLSQEATRFSAPVSIPMFLSGNYGEIRTAHFHAGIDIKTQQSEGKEVLAAADGFTFRLVVSPTGYGKALYIRHTNGMVTVYGHLSRFAPSVDEWVTTQQYRRKSFAVDLNPQSGQFTFKQGQLIGYSGNSGSSGGPHLHFEIRDPSVSIPIDPLNYGFNIADHLPPRINWLAIYPLHAGTMINGQCKKALIPVSGNDGRYILDEDFPEINGWAGFGIETFDYLNHSANPCTPRVLELLSGDQTIFRCTFDSIPFSVTSYVNLHIDYAERMESGRVVHKLFLEKYNPLPIYAQKYPAGRLLFSDTLLHRISIRAIDVYGNASTLDFSVKGSRPFQPCQTESPDTTGPFWFLPNKPNLYEEREIRVLVPAHTLLEPCLFGMNKEHGFPGIVSSVFLLKPESTPVKGTIALSLNAENISESLRDRLFIVAVRKDGKNVPYPSVYSNGYVTAKVGGFGRYALAVDTLLPSITARDFETGKRYEAGDSLIFEISDGNSGIGNYNGFIDNRWALLEFDPKTGLLVYRVDSARLGLGREHTLKIVVADQSENISVFEGSFLF